MKFPVQKKEFRGWSACLILAGSAMVSGCLQTAPVVVVTPQDQAARLVYTCSNGKILDVTRVQGNSSALVVIDGRTVQLPRDTATTSAERYTNRIQTLTLFGSSASLVALGRVTYGPCTIGGASGVPDYEPDTRRRRRIHDVD
jgi:hypothetical protein